MEAGGKEWFWCKAGAPLLGIHQPAVEPATRQACDPASSSNGDQTPRAKLSEFADHPRSAQNYYQDHVTNVRGRWDERYDTVGSICMR